MLSMTGRVTMRGMARWADQGGSYRTLQRFFTTSLSWGTLQWVLMRHHRFAHDDVLVMGGDEGVVTKAGKQTYGLDRFFSSLDGKRVPGLCLLRLSLMSVKRRTSSPSNSNFRSQDVSSLGLSLRASADSSFDSSLSPLIMKSIR
jgi:putative transposase